MEVIEIGSQEELDEFVRRWTEEIERLKTWNSELADACDDLRAERGGLKRRVAELEAENAGLRAALEPFAEYAELFDGWDYPTAPNTPLSVDIDYTCDLCLRVQDFRRARAALERIRAREERP